MQYRAVENRCAIDLSSLPLPQEQALALLEVLGFKVVMVCVVETARRLIGQSMYSRGALFGEAPAVLDCSGLVKWVYGQKGIWVPRLSIQQFVHGEEVEISDVRAGDVLFTSGYVNFYDTDPSIRVGHVGLATGEGTVIHAAGKRTGVIEVPVERFIGSRTLQGVRRFQSPDVITLQTPSNRLVEWSDDIKWILLQNIAKLDHP